MQKLGIDVRVITEHEQSCATKVLYPLDNAAQVDRDLHLSRRDGRQAVRS
jgi:hypothetical protein